MRSQPTARRRFSRIVLFLLAPAMISALVGQAYSLKSVKWKNPPVPYYVNASNADVSEAEAEAAIRHGADAWSVQSNASFAFAYAGRTTGSAAQYNGRNEVFFSTEANGATLATTYYWSSSATGELLDFDIKFYDGGFRFFTGTAGCSSGAYIEDVATHEFGHGLGLNHSSIEDATMYGTTGWCSQNWRTLHSDDIAGIEALYPPGGASPTPPAAPSNLAAARNAASPTSAVDLSWSDNSTNEDRFLIERSLDGAVFVQVASLPAGTRTYTDSGLVAATTYVYRVRAANAAGFSGYTNLASVTTAAASTAPPSAPTAVSPANGATGVSVEADLAWSSSGATSYDVYFGTSSSPPAYATGLTSPSLPLPALSAATTYYWRVVARNAFGSTPGSVWSFTTKAVRAKGKARS